ncbi:MAG TPA: amidophosphoribosyltransferase [Candidatus Micrarchaeota archaeon]|nr:amidophosphoribosyltransferase [Candidatus Micrarchaeota archaeon]
MLTQLRESCGIVGMYSYGKSDVSFELFSGLIAVQHRGQDSAGIASYDGAKINMIKNVGLVADAMPGESYRQAAGFAGIGHVRYPTIGVSFAQDAQPMVKKFGKLTVALAHNGNIANYGTLRAKLEKENGLLLETTCDTELVLWVFGTELEKSGDVFAAVKKCMEILDGSYSMVAVTSRGEVVAFRDPLAIKPLVYGKTDKGIFFASESVALDMNGFKLTGDLKPGEVMVVSAKGTESKVVMPSKRAAHCMFEYVYFARPDSVMDGKLVYDVRMELGKRLAMQKPVKADMVVPVPDTARAAAEGYSQESKIPVVEGLIKNRYVGRTFIMPSQAKREAAVRLKLNAIAGKLAGKKVVLIDDSIVRGTTMGPIVRLVRAAGAKQVHVRITCPPIISPCFYGIDIPTYRELIATRMSVEEIGKSIGADSLDYLTVDNLVESIGMQKGELCLGCITDDYVTEFGRKIAGKLKLEKASDVASRMWEQDV